MSGPLGEIKEADATGAIAEIYADIRNSLRVPMVNLIFRHMATIPDCLEWAWRNIGPVYASGQVVAAAEKLLAEQPLLSLHVPPDVWGADHKAVGATCAAYARANPANLLALKALQFILAESGQGRARRKPLRGLPPRPAAVELAPLPPMADLASLNDETKKTLAALTAQLHGPDGRVIPSFYRHFTAWPKLLSGVHDALQPLIDDGTLNAAAAALNRDAHGYARVLYLDCPATRGGPPSEAALNTLGELLELFPPNICKLTLIARALGVVVG
jgi:hypothetical protein